MEKGLFLAEIKCYRTSFIGINYKLIGKIMRCVVRMHRFIICNADKFFSPLSFLERPLIKEQNVTAF